MKILAIGDLHFKTSNDKECTILCYKLLEKAKELDPEFIVVLGDTLDRHEQINVFPLKKAVDFLYKLSKIKYTVLLIGNHDRPNNSDYLTDNHPFNALKEWSNFLVVDTVKKLTFRDINFLFVPYVMPGLFKKAISGQKDYDMIFAHQEFYGADYGIFSTKGDVWEKDLPYVLSGHIHNYQKLQENITYIGTPMQHSWNDSKDKYIGLVNIEKWSNSKDSIVEVNIELIPTNYTKKTTYNLNIADIKTFVLKKEQNEEVRLVITGKSSEIKDLIKSKKLSKLDCKVVFNEIVENVPIEQSNEDFLSRLKKKVDTELLNEILNFSV